MSNHEWCQDVSRDKAVRAAEDAAAVPSIQHRDLPEQVALLWASVTDILGRVVRIEVEMDAGEAEEAAPAACDPASPGEGIRTERVTLEVTHDCLYPAAEWVLEAVQERFDGPAESVRVVEEADTVSDEAVSLGVTLRALAETRESLAAANRGIARLAAERDAARAEAERLRARLLRAEITRLREERRWIPVGERSPEVDSSVFVTWRYGKGKKQAVSQAWYDPLGKFMSLEDMALPGVTHWQPLPAPPSEGEVEG